MEQPSKLLTVEEASRTLEQVRPLVEQLQRLQASILARDLGHDNGNGHGPVQQQALVKEFEAALSKLEELGGVLKDLGEGLVDFYSLRDGHIVFLCWRLGEDRVGFWHSVDTGFANRQPV